MLQPLHQPHYSSFNSNLTLLKWARGTTREVFITELRQISVSRSKPKGRLMSRDLPLLAILRQRAQGNMPREEIQGQPPSLKISRFAVSYI